MEASLHCHNLLVAELAEDELARVTLYCGERVVGDVLVFNLVFVGYLVHEAAKACAENYSCLGRNQPQYL